MKSKELKSKLKFISDYNKASNASTGSKYDSNANVANKNLATQECELSKKDFIDLNRAFVNIYLKPYGKKYVKSFKKDLKHHIIYSHDESSLKPYCVAASLYPFLLNGLQGLGGSAFEPKHANSFIGSIINLIFLLSSQFAGAVAIPEFLTYFDHFLRLDYGQDYINHLDDVVEKVGEHEFTLRHKIEDWFQQFVYSVNQPAGARNYQSPFINISYFDKYYFKSIFGEFFFPDGDEPCWETTKELQKMFMKWFNKEREKTTITFPVESFNLLVDKETQQYKDAESADFCAEMHAEGHSFFIYQSDSADSLSSCCRLRNGIEENVFSTSMGAGGVMTGSKKVITLNLNRITQDWYRKSHRLLFRYKGTLADYIAEVTERVHKYLNAWNDKLHDDFNNDMLPAYKAGFISLDKQFLTVGVNGFVEAAEFLKSLGDKAPDEYRNMEIKPNNYAYRCLSMDILGTIEKVNKKNRTATNKYNLEFVPGENASAKLYAWDKRDGYVVPKGRNLYNSYFYIVEDPTIDPVQKFYYQGHGFADVCSGGVALHNNLDAFLSKKQYRYLMDVAVKAGCNYWTYNIPTTICNECGHRDKRYLHKCPHCGSTNLDYETRVIGYLRRVSNFSEPRQLEASRRAYNSPEFPYEAGKHIALDKEYAKEVKEWEKYHNKTKVPRKKKSKDA